MYVCVYIIYAHMHKSICIFSYDSSISCSVSPGAQALTAPMKSDKLQLPINKAPLELTSSAVVAVVWVTAAACENNDALVRHAFISPV